MKSNQSSRPEQKAEERNQSFYRELFTFTVHGKLKNMDFMYSMVLGFLILFVYFFVSHFITIALESMFPNLSRSMLNILDIGVPAILVAALSCGLFFVLKKKYLLLWGYIVSLLLILFVILFMLFRYQPETKTVLLPVVIYMFLIPVAFGAICVFLLSFLYYRKTKQNP